VESFLKGSGRMGYFVRRERRVRRTGRCSVCGGEYEYTTEKRVDTRLVADLIHFAANGAYEAAVLVSGDDDFVPAVEAVNALGKQVWVATLSPDELSSDLRVRCFGHVDLREGVGAFRAIAHLPAPEPGPRAGVNTARVARRGLAPAHPAPRLAGCSARTRLPHVSRGYFVTRWKAHQLPRPARSAICSCSSSSGGARGEFNPERRWRLITAIRSRGRRPPGISGGRRAVVRAGTLTTASTALAIISVSLVAWIAGWHNPARSPVTSAPADGTAIERPSRARDRKPWLHTVVATANGRPRGT
jgi:hypothetical protein